MSKDDREADKRRRIMEAARQRFRQFGVKKTTMQEIADDAQVAVGTLYLYFSSKDAIGIACTEDFVRKHREQADRILASDANADEKLLEYFTTRFREALETRTSSKHAAELAREVLRLKPDRIREEGMMMWETVTKILREGVEAGLFSIDQPEEDAKILLYSTAYFFPNAMMQMPQYPTEEELLVVLRWFLNVWRPDLDPTRKRQATATSAKRL